MRFETDAVEIVKRNFWNRVTCETAGALSINSVDSRRAVVLKWSSSLKRLRTAGVEQLNFRSSQVNGVVAS